MARWALAVALSGWLPGCWPPATDTAPRQGFGRVTPRHGPDELWVGMPGEPSTLDPARCNESLCGDIVQNLYAGLVSLVGPELQPVGDLAERWQVSDDGLTYHFFLRASRWSDGRPVTAHDWVASIRRVLTPATAAPSAHLLFVIEGAEAFYRDTAPADALGVVALDARTLQIRLTQPAPWFLQLTANSVLRPVPRHVAEAVGTPWPAPVGLVTSGAYRVASWRFRRDATFVRNAGYWDAANVPLQGVHAWLVANADTAMALYEYGALDVLGTHVPVAWQRQVQNTADVVDVPSLTTHFYWLNTRRPPLHDVRVRRALSLAIDRAALVREVLHGNAIPTGTLVPADIGGAAAAPLVDVAQAQRLLAQAGFPGGHGLRPLRLSFNADESHRHVAQAIQAMWQANLGISCTLSQQEWRVYLADLDRNDFDVARLGWIADYADPRSFLSDVFSTDGGNNHSGWRDSKFDSDVRDSDGQSDAAARRALLQNAERRMLAAQPLIPLTFGRDKTLIKPYVRGFVPNPLHLHPWQRLRIAAPQAP